MGNIVSCASGRINSTMNNSNNLTEHNNNTDTDEDEDDEFINYERNRRNTTTAFVFPSHGLSNAARRHTVCINKPVNPLDRRDEHGEAKLHRLSSKGDDKNIKRLLKDGANIDITTRLGQTPLHIAATKRKVSTVQLLIENQASVNMSDLYGRVPLHVAVETGDLGVIKYLVEAGSNLDAQDGLYWTPLHIATSEGHTKVVEYLVKSGCNPNLQDNSHFTPLQIACSLGHHGVVKELVSASVRYNMRTSYGETALHIALVNKHEHIVSLLLSAFHDDVFLNTMDFKGHTALHIATELSLEKCVYEIVDNGGDIGLSDNEGLTPIHIAVNKGHFHIVSHLIQMNQDAINSQSRQGVTPLHIAFDKHSLACQTGDYCEENNCLNIIKMLLKFGANIHLYNNQSVFPLMIGINTEINDTCNPQVHLLRLVANYMLHENHTDKYELHGDAVAQEMCRKVTVLNKDKILKATKILLEGGIISYTNVQFILLMCKLPLVEDYLSIPMMLKCLSRIVIRKYIDIDLIDELNIPSQLNQFLKYSDC